jgi:hypothetical protein
VRCVDAACGAFALWTLCCHATVALGGSLRASVAAFAWSGLALLVLGLGRRRGGTRGVAARAPVTPPPLAPAAGGLRAVALALALAAAWFWRDAPLALWWASLGLLGLAAVGTVVREAPHGEPAVGSGGRERALLGLALLCAVLALVSHRVDIDDAFYVNLAAAAVDAPAAPLLAADDLHGVEGLPLHLPVYRLHSYEMAVAAFSWLSGVRAIAGFHLVATALAAALVPLCFARLFRLLTPAHWLFATGALVVVLFAAGDMHLWYGNFAFVRIWQGKSLLLVVFLPLVQAYAIAYALAPSRRRWLRLAAAQIAAVGVSASGLWLAPAAALSAAAAALPFERRSLARLALVALASIYVLAAGWSLREAMNTVPDAVAELPAEGAGDAGAGRALGDAFYAVLGDGPLRVAALAAVLGAWACWGAGLARRFAVVVPLAALVVVLDPYASEWMERNVTGPYYWRALWALPVPVLLALALTSPLQAAGRWPRGATALAVLGLAAFAVALPRVPGLGAENRVRLDLPGLKVEPEPYEWARRITETAGAGAVVVAPDAVGVWLPTFHQRVSPLVVRAHYLTPHLDALGEQDVLHRLFMTGYVSGRVHRPDALKLFAAGLQRFDVDAVCLHGLSDARPVRRVLRGAGFDLVASEGRYELWLRHRGAPRRRRFRDARRRPRAGSRDRAGGMLASPPQRCGARRPDAEGLP